MQLLHTADAGATVPVFDKICRDPNYLAISQDLHQMWVTEEKIPWIDIGATIFDFHGISISEAEMETACLVDIDI